jgi:Amt family ammonium transporter
MRERKKGFTLLFLFVLAYLLTTMVAGSLLAQDGDTEAGEEETTAEVVAEEAEVAAEPGADLAAVISNLDTVWMLVAGFLVFFMQAGFALVEAGFVRAKTVVNIFMKNLFDLSIGAIGYWAIGFGLMFGAGNAFFGTEWFFLSDLPEIYPDLTVPSYAFFFFQFAFAATAATIASGAMAGRTDFRGYLIYSLVVTIFIYPVVGHWIWGGGWLADMGFFDFAGSTVVHSTGAWVGLMGAVILGPRLNRFGPDGVPMPGHSMTLAALGTFILWLGWFGFNPGSQLDADAASIALITVTTNIAAAAGAIAAMFTGWFFVGKPQLPWGLNGALAGLVAITAPCAIVTPAEAIVIGAIGGIIMYIGVNFLERMRVDDVVGAVSVHGFSGVWGTLAVGIFGAEIGLLHGGGLDQLITQIIGIVAVGVFVIVTSGVVFYIINAIGWLRAEREGEILGLDIYEHGMVAYPEFTNSPSEPVPFS